MAQPVTVPSRSPVLVSIVTYNDARRLPGCLDALQRQTVSHRVRIFDNASDDGTPEAARRREVELFESDRNLGFSRGHNINLLPEDFEHALLLNADVVPEPDFLERLMEALEAVPGAGMAGGKLLRSEPDRPQGGRVLDSAGIYFTPALRHFDRGSEQEDRGSYDRRQLVFGITGAALLCRREMLEDVRWRDEYLDEDFFAYREDADLAWRAQLLGWKAVYEPSARAGHLRRVTPARRRELSSLINYHSLKNRYLLRRKNIDWAVALRCFPFMWLRDAGILAYVALRERKSWPAFREVRRLAPRFREKRLWIQRKRRVSPRRMARWFSFRPVAFDL